MTTYSPGDIVNGHQLNESGTEWVPLAQYSAGYPQPDVPPASGKGRSLGKKIGLGVGAGFLGLLVIGALAPDPAGSAGASEAPPAAPSTSQSQVATDEPSAEPSQAPVTSEPAADPDPEQSKSTDPTTDPDESNGDVEVVAKQRFTQPGDDPDADLAFVIMAKLSPSIDGDKGWSDRRILTLGGKTASMWENGAKEAEVLDYLQDNGMTMLTSYYFMAGAIETYCSSEAADRYSS